MMSFDWASVGITVMAYSRPKHVARLFAALRALGVDRFSVFMDGADDHVIRQSQDEIVETIAGIDWAEVVVTRRSINMGLRRSIVSAVTDQLTRHDAIILLEDDCVPRQGFFEFMVEALSVFRDRRDIRSVCGYQFPSVADSSAAVSAVASSRFVPWGWGTWRDRWNDYDTDLAHLVNLVDQNGLYPRLPRDVRRFLSTWERARETDIWSINWVLAHYLTGTYCMYPSQSLISNIGFDGTGVHCYETAAFNVDEGSGEQRLTVAIDPETALIPSLDMQIVTYMERHWSATMSPSSEQSPEFLASARIGELTGEILDRTPIFDVHTHLLPEPGGGVSLSGPDELLTYHYLMVEAIRASGADPGRFFSMTKLDQATFVWDTLFRSRTPVSEACRGVLTILSHFGITAGPRRYDDIRRELMECTYEPLDVLSSARIEHLVMTNDPFDPEEWTIFDQEDWDRSVFRASIRLDQLFLSSEVRSRFFGRSDDRGGDSSLDGAALSDFLDRQTEHSRPVYAALSTCGSDLAEAVVDPVFSDGIVPWLARHDLALALMIGVKRSVNPSLGLGGDGLGGDGLTALEELLRRYPEQNFLVTHLREDAQYALTVLARKFPNLKLLGCWWFANHPGLVRRNLEMRFDLLGLDFIAHHSDARVLEQLIYKWSHFKEELRTALATRYRRAVRDGWPVDREMIERDIRALMSGNAESSIPRRSDAADSED